MLSNLKQYNIILASASPRRKELLEKIGIDFKIKLIDGIDESYPKGLDGDEIVKYISQKKAEAHLKQISDKDLIITADTIVYANNSVFGKPKNYEEAKQMLKSLSGKTHLVITGVTIATHLKRRTFAVQSEVSFAQLSDVELDYYINTYQPYDKAGAYGIQEWIGMIGVNRLNGCFFNVMGLPIHHIYQELKNFNK
jgi:septum formation protein